ncbi:MAG: LytTR family DNA-binding domain-containing protein [Gemmatimonadota bacterium]
MTSIRTLIIDDESLARRGIRARLPASEFEIVSECSSGSNAIESICALEPDLVFLDVQMPELDGFAVVERVGVERMPLVVFVTAFDAYAVRAFESRAIDYLLKPIDDSRFADTLTRVRERMRDRAAGALAVQLEAMLADTTRVTLPPPRFAVRDRGRVVLLDPRDIEWIGADGDYVRIIAGARSFLMRETLTAITARLSPPQFVRIHRSTIANVEHIRELEPLPNREYVVVMRSGVQLRSSRSYDDSLRGLLALLSRRSQP